MKSPERSEPIERRADDRLASVSESVKRTRTVERPDIRRFYAAILALLIIGPPFLVVIAADWPQPVAIAVGLAINAVAALVGYKAIGRRIETDTA